MKRVTVYVLVLLSTEQMFPFLFDLQGGGSTEAKRRRKMSLLQCKLILKESQNKGKPEDSRSSRQAELEFPGLSC